MSGESLSCDIIVSVHTEAFFLLHETSDSRARECGREPLPTQAGGSGVPPRRSACAPRFQDTFSRIAGTEADRAG